MQPTLSTRTARVLGSGLVVASLAASAVAWPDLPAEMAVHWNAAGEVDDTAPRAVGALVVPLLAAGLLVVFEAIPRIDPLGENVAAFRGYYNGLVAVVLGLLAVVHAVLLAVNLGWAGPVGPLIFAGTGVVLAYVGVLLDHAEPNWFVGIRTPWTLSSEGVWRRTHDLAARLFVLAGGVLVFAAAAGPLLDARTVTAGVVVVVVLAALVPVAYSYYLYERLGRPDDVPGGS